MARRREPFMNAIGPTGIYNMAQNLFELVKWFVLRAGDSDVEGVIALIVVFGLCFWIFITSFLSWRKSSDRAEEKSIVQHQTFIKNETVIIVVATPEENNGGAQDSANHHLPVAPGPRKDS
jgi:hypothetical protein